MHLKSEDKPDRCRHGDKTGLIRSSKLCKLHKINRGRQLQKCANMIYSLSNFQGQKILDGRFGAYKTQLRNLFSVLQSKSIFDIEGMQLLIDMLNIIRDNNMKLDGQFATLLTNMVVLQSIAKEIDPTIRILKCAVPYFRFVESPNQEISIPNNLLA